MNEVKAICPICLEKRVFGRPMRAALIDRSAALSCPYSRCTDKGRALAFAIRRDFSADVLHSAPIHDLWTSRDEISHWFQRNSINYVSSGFFPDEEFGIIINGFRNENAEDQTFDDNSFQLVFHNHSLEHFPNIYVLLNEVYRTLVPGGKFYFHGYTFDTSKTRQLASIGESEIVFHEKPKYHGEALVFWKFGHDLPHLITENTNFDVEICRFKSKLAVCFSEMEEIYILTKPL